MHGQNHIKLIMLVLGLRFSLAPCVYPSPSAKEGPGAYSGGSVLVHKKINHSVGLENYKRGTQQVAK